MESKVRTSSAAESAEAGTLFDDMTNHFAAAANLRPARQQNILHEAGCDDLFCLGLS